jgi:NADH-quinone oxidoreductase subunit I
VYNIDYNRCIFCGYCVEACPTDAITHGHGFELASLNATTLVMRKEDMLVLAPHVPDEPTSEKDEAEVLA